MATLSSVIAMATEKKSKSKKKLLASDCGVPKEDASEGFPMSVAAVSDSGVAEGNLLYGILHGSSDGGPMKSKLSRGKMGEVSGVSGPPLALGAVEPPQLGVLTKKSPRHSVGEHSAPSVAALSPTNASRKRAASAREVPSSSSASIERHLPNAAPSTLGSSPPNATSPRTLALTSSTSFGSLPSDTSTHDPHGSTIESPLHSPTSSRHSTQPLGAGTLIRESSSSTIGSSHSETSSGAYKRHPHAERHQLGERPPSMQELRLSRNDHAHDKLVQFFGDPHVVEDCAKQGWAPQPRHVREMKLRQRFGEEVPFHTVSPQKTRPKPVGHHREASSDSESLSTDADPEVVAKEREIRSSHKVHRFFGEYTAGSDAFASLSRPKSSPSLNLAAIPTARATLDSKSLEQESPEEDDPFLDADYARPKSARTPISRKRTNHALPLQSDAGAGHSFASALSPRRNSQHPPHRSKKHDHPHSEDELDESSPSVQPANVDVLKLNKFFGRRVNIVKVEIAHVRQKRSGSRDDMFFKSTMEISRVLDDSPASSMVSEYCLMAPNGDASGSGGGSGGLAGGSNYLAQYDYGRCSTSSERGRRNSDSEERPASPSMAAAVAEYVSQGTSHFVESGDVGVAGFKSKSKTSTGKKEKFPYSDAIGASTSSPALRTRKSSKTLKNSPLAEVQHATAPSVSSSTSTLASKGSVKSLKSSTASRKSSKHKLDTGELSDSSDTKDVKTKDNKEIRKMKRRSTLTHLSAATDDKTAKASALSTSSTQVAHNRVDSSGGSDDELRLEQVRESHRNRKLRRMFGEDITHTDVQTAPQANWTKLNRQFTFGRSSAAPPPTQEF